MGFVHAECVNLNRKDTKMKTRVPKVEIDIDSGGEYYWRKVAANGEIVTTGESHPHKSDAKKAAKRENPGLPIVEVFNGG